MPWQGTTSLHLRALALAAAALLLLFGCAAGSAGAAESAWPTAQAKAFNFDFVPYLDPPPNPVSVCLVDTGVDVTPDTPADSPDGPILKRMALDGGSGESGSAEWPHPHGTYMAATAVAGMNDWGTVGMWPGGRIVSIRAMQPDSEVFRFEDYRRAMQLCNQTPAGLDVRVVNLALACECAESPDERDRLRNAVDVAHRAGLNVVAGVGNAARSDISSPANLEGIFAVGAAGTNGPCSFSNGAPEDVALFGPGCEMDGALLANGNPFTEWSGGTSAASLNASTALALLRSYMPSLAWRQAESALRESTRDVNGAPYLDLAQAFRVAGLGDIVKRASDRQTVASSTTREGQPTAAPMAPPELGAKIDLPFTAKRAPAPRFRLSRSRRFVRIRIANRPPGARVNVVLQSRVSDFHYRTLQRKLSRSRSWRIRLPRRAARIGVQFVTSKTSSGVVWRSIS